MKEIALPSDPALNDQQDPTVAMFFLADFLRRHGVSACVIGGTAVASVCSSRIASDLDIVIAPNRRSAKRALAAFGLLASHFYCQETKPVLAAPAELASGAELSLRMSIGKVDVVGHSLPVGIDRRLLVARRVSVSYGGYQVERASIADLIDIKEQVARPVDLDDVRALRSVAATEQTFRFTRWRRR